MRFEHPQYLWILLPALGALGAFFYWAWRTKQRLIAAFVSARLLPTLLLNVALDRQKARMWLVLAAVGLVLLALARPQIGFSFEEVRSRGLDIVVAIDTSRSMLATDVAPNRLRRAQLAALDLKRIARSDRVGLVAFAGGAFLQCPLTLDDEAFRQSVEALDVAIIPQGGTAIAEAIQTARSAFKEGNDNHKVLVLFTDGEDHDGQAMETATAAAKDGMRIFTIGVGTPNGDVLRTTDATGRSEFIKGPDGNAVRSQLNETLLKELATETGGFYLQLSGAGTVNMLYERGLAPLPRSEQAAQKVRRYHERYQWLLALALVLLLAEMFVPERKESKETKRASSASSPGVAKGTPAAARAAVIALILLAGLPWGAWAGPGSAKKQYESGKFEAAQNEYERLLRRKSEDPRLQFNAGTAALQSKDYETAAGHLTTALNSPDLKLQQSAYYNLGNTRFRMGEDAADDKKQGLWQEAVKHFESALKLDARDADAQYNLDFVKKKIEELKQQQQQQKKDQKQDSKDNKDDKNKQDQSKKDDQKPDESKQDSQKDRKDDPQKQQEQKDQQQKQDEQKDKEKEQQQQQSQQNKDDKGEEKPGQQAQPQDQGENPEQPDGSPQAARVQMKPEDAIRLLEALKADEKAMPFRPVLKTNRTPRVFKDW